MKQMILTAKNKEQASHIANIIQQEYDIDNDVWEFPIMSIEIDKPITFDQMAEIVDYLRGIQDKKDELFEQCWVSYRRKGSKKKAREYWNKLKRNEKDMVLPHIRAYVTTRELSYQKDFERYLRDKIFTTLVIQGNSVVYDPTKDSSRQTDFLENKQPLKDNLIINGQIYR